MAVPFRKVSKTRKRMRRAHNALVAKTVTTCPNCGAILEDSKIRECPYCKSHVTPKQYHYALSSVDIIESNVDTIE